MSATGRNATQLAAKNPIPVFDERLGFTEATHAYYLDGRKFYGPSVTTLIKRLFPEEPFNGPLIIQKYLGSWRKNEAHRYYPLVLNKTDAEAEKSSSPSGSGPTSSARFCTASPSCT